MQIEELRVKVSEYEQYRTDIAHYKRQIEEYRIKIEHYEVQIREFTSKQA